VTPWKLRESITTKLRAYINEPEVAVSVQQVKSKIFNVLGEVQHPGAYPLLRPMRVLDALATAGSFRDDFAKVSKIYLLRPTSSGGTIRIPFNYKQVIKGEHIEQNVELKPGDTLVIP
jgi:polysaccharide export outer membrane protein